MLSVRERDLLIQESKDDNDNSVHKAGLMGGWPHVWLASCAAGLLCGWPHIETSPRAACRGPALAGGRALPRAAAGKSAPAGPPEGAPCES